MAPSRTRALRLSAHPLTPPAIGLGLAEVLGLVVVTAVFIGWALWTLLLPAQPGPTYLNGSFGTARQADYQSDLDRRLAPQRSIGRG